MQFTALIALLASTALAAPSTVERRQFGSSSSNELTRGSCRDVTYIFARGSTELGNMGATIGPQSCSRAKSELGSSNVACQGVGGAYTASLTPNALSDGTTRAAIREATSLFEQAANDCPETTIIAGGYSQGAALMAATISDLDDSIKDRIAGVALFGYTKNLQNRGRIPDFPADKTKVYCNTGDLVCTGTLTITAAHLTYGTDARNAGRFFRDSVNALN
ncbi:hypothetical protein MBLNU230_g7250t1 [Neophaeotheca triangularis]